MYGEPDAPQSDRTHRVATPQAISDGEHVVTENFHVTVDKVAAMLHISYGSDHFNIHDFMQFHKVSAMWLPRQLTLEFKERRMNVCQELF